MTTYIILFLSVILLFYIKHRINKKIDDDLQESLNKPGRATYIRNNFSDVIVHIEKITQWSISKERNDAIFIGDLSKEYICLTQDIGKLKIIYIKNGNVIQQWSFNQNTSTREITNKITNYLI